MKTNDWKCVDGLDVSTIYMEVMRAQIEPLTDDPSGDQLVVSDPHLYRLL
jgi:hypothetical protein